MKQAIVFSIQKMLIFILHPVDKSICQILLFTMPFFGPNLYMNCSFLFILSIKSKTKMFLHRNILSKQALNSRNLAYVLISSSTLIGNVWIIKKKCEEYFCLFYNLRSLVGLNYKLTLQNNLPCLYNYRTSNLQIYFTELHNFVKVRIDCINLCNHLSCKKSQSSGLHPNQNTPFLVLEFSGQSS